MNTALQIATALSFPATLFVLLIWLARHPSERQADRE